jgi:hypothetical protein
VEPIGNTLSQLQITNGVNYLMLTVVGRSRTQKTQAIPGGRMQTYLGVGYGVVIPYTISRIGGEFKQGYEYGGQAWQAYTGFEYRVSPDWGFFFEYKYSDFDARVSAAGGGHFETRLKTSHFALGTSYRIG